MIVLFRSAVDEQSTALLAYLLLLLFCFSVLVVLGPSIITITHTYCIILLSQIPIHNFISQTRLCKSHHIYNHNAITSTHLTEDQSPRNVNS
jgi:hypothetical protein